MVLVEGRGREIWLVWEEVFSEENKEPPSARMDSKTRTSCLFIITWGNRKGHFRHNDCVSSDVVQPLSDLRRWTFKLMRMMRWDDEKAYMSHGYFPSPPLPVISLVFNNNCLPPSFPWFYFLPFSLFTYHSFPSSLPVSSSLLPVLTNPLRPSVDLPNALTWSRKTSVVPDAVEAPNRAVDAW